MVAWQMYRRLPTPIISSQVNILCGCKAPQELRKGRSRDMRKVTILVAVATLMVALVAGTAAAKQNGKYRATYNFKGTLEEVASDGSYVAVDVTDGNGRGRDIAEAYAEDNPGEPMVFPVTSETKVEINDAPASPSDLVIGNEVKIQSKAAKDATSATTFDARKVSVENETEEDYTTLVN
jgi:hypothetical protein